MAAHSLPLTWSITFSFLFWFPTSSFTFFFLPSCALLPFPAPSPVLALLFMPSVHPIPLSHFLSHHTHSQALQSYTISLGCCLPQARWLPSKVDQQKMPAISMPQQLISGFQIQQTVTGSDVPEMFAVAAVVGYGPTHLLSLSEVPWATAPPVLSKMTLIYMSVN